VMVAVHHLAAPERAERLAADLEERLPNLRELYVSELGAAVGAHVGPGAVGLVVAPAAPARPSDVGDRPQEAEDR
jgi:fatty acid-binding protein DegV